MQSQTMPRAVAAGTVIVAAALVLLARAPNGERPPVVVQPDVREAAGPSDAPVALAAAEPVAPPSDALVAAKVRELEAMSETFRNTTFVIAIRDAGYVCNELLRVYGGIDDSGKWTASCSEMLSYTVAVMADGGLHVEPMLQYFDGNGPAVPQEPGPMRPPLLLPPPQPQPR